MKPPDENPESRPDWSVLIRDIAVFQFKLLVDGLRDLVLVPASLVAGVISLFKTRNGEPGSEFYRVVGVGKQSERWINLFGALENAPADVANKDHFGDRDIDEIVSKVEAFVVDEYRRGGVTAQARDSLQKAMDRMRRSGPKPPP
jgi:hypothetical protein